MTGIAATISSSHSDPSTRIAGAARRAEGAVSRRAAVAGAIVSGLAVAFLGFDAALKVLELGPAVDGTAQLGYPVTVIRGIGLIQILCLAVYLVPRTSILGAVLWTGYLGGAIATHVRVGSPLFSHTLFPIYVAALLWGGLWLRDLRVRGLIAGRPLRAR